MQRLQGVECLLAPIITEVRLAFRYRFAHHLLVALAE
ncbi:hypothetical protein EVA_13143 [gut metagenome]|uniref:Uncharacterized protein n=1 Tax=gut metagenome TaxID=749906 RepID=J9GH65_9ZZZZ